MPKVTRRSASMPRSTRLTLTRLLVKSPATTSSTIDSAICAVASVVRKRDAAARARRLAGLALERRRPDRAACCAAPGTARRGGRCRASAPPRRAARCGRSDVDRVRPPSAGSSAAISAERPPRTTSSRRRRRRPRAAPTRSAAGAISCQRLAPIDSRTAISPARAAARASSRLAMLAQAISSTTPVTPSSSVERRSRLAAIVALPAAPGSTADGLALKRAIVCSLMSCLQRRLDVVEDRRDTARSSAARACSIVDARLQPREQVDPVAAAVVEPVRSRAAQLLAHRDRHEDLRLAPSVVPVEARRRDADDRSGARR